MDIFEWLLRLEDSDLAGEVVSLGDGAGLTRFGITTRDDVNFVPPSFWSEPPADAIQHARDFYKARFWDMLHLDDYPMPLAASMLSCAVVCGISAMLRFYDYAHSVGLGPDAQLEAFIRRWKVHNQWAVRTNPNDARFLRGWNNRADAIYPNLPGATHA